MVGQPEPTPRGAPRVTAIAEADPSGGALRYRGVDVGELVGVVPFDRVWGLLVADDLSRLLPPAEIFPLPARTGDMSADVVSALASVAPVWGFRPLHDIDDGTALDHLARTTVLMLSFVAQSARGPDLPVIPQRVVDEADSVIGRFLVRWRGEADPRHVDALDSYFVIAAEHGFNASTYTARLVASTGADVATCMAAACAASRGPRHAGAPARVVRLLQALEAEDDPRAYLTHLLDSGVRIMGFGHSIYRTRDPRADILREVCRRLDAPLFGLAAETEAIATELLAERHPDEPVHANLEFWAAVLLSFAEVPSSAFTALFACARAAGWSAHILEQKGLTSVIRPRAVYEGAAPRPLREVPGWDEMTRGTHPTDVRPEQEGPS